MSVSINSVITYIFGRTTALVALAASSLMCTQESKPYDDFRVSIYFFKATGRGLTQPEGISRDFCSRIMSRNATNGRQW